MWEVTTIGLDIAKNVFHAHDADANGRALFSRKISRTKLLEFFAEQPRCPVALEACGGSHHWARELTLLGHKVKLIPPAYVMPFVKRNKNDEVDAEAICEATQRPRMRFVARYLSSTPGLRVCSVAMSYSCRSLTTKPTSSNRQLSLRRGRAFEVVADVR